MTDTNKVDLDEAEKRAAGFRGTWRAMSYDSGAEVLEFVAEGADPAGDVDEIAQFACDDETQRAIVATLNAAPALIAEVRSMRKDRAAVAAMLRVSVQNGELTDKLIETSHRLMDEVVSLRAELRNVLDSAMPNRRDHPTMSAAWSRAEALLARTKGG